MTLVIITGPLAAGKSTLMKKLGCNVGEMQQGVDVAKPNWWEKVERFAAIHDTCTVETHLDSEGRDAVDGYNDNWLPTKAIRPPARIKIVFVLPDLDVLFKRQLNRDYMTTKADSAFNLQWYERLRELLT
jgi:hypothetical protein